MKKLVSIILILGIMLVPILSYAAFEIDTSNSIVQDGWVKGTHHTVVEAVGGNIDPDRVRESLEGVRFTFSQGYTVHILSYSTYLQDTLGKALPDNRIILYDFTPLDSPEIYQRAVVHELGHLVYMSLSDWEKGYYKILRGIPEDWTDYASTYYTNRPQEIFAEDFRILFGDDVSSQGRHMNEELVDPKCVQGLKSFIRDYR